MPMDHASPLVSRSLFTTEDAAFQNRWDYKYQQTKTATVNEIVLKSFLSAYRSFCTTCHRASHSIRTMSRPVRTSRSCWIYNQRTRKLWVVMDVYQRWQEKSRTLRKYWKMRCTSQREEKTNNLQNRCVQRKYSTLNVIYAHMYFTQSVVQLHASNRSNIITMHDLSKWRSLIVSRNLW